MTKYQIELQQLKPYDEVQTSENMRDFEFITTAGHGYLAVPKDHPAYYKAIEFCKYGFKGELACYLEEDSEAPEFFKYLDDIVNIPF